MGYCRMQCLFRKCKMSMKFICFVVNFGSSSYLDYALWGDRKLYKSYSYGAYSHLHVCFRQPRSSCSGSTSSTFSEFLKDRLGQINIWYGLFYSFSIFSLECAWNGCSHCFVFHEQWHYSSPPFFFSRVSLSSHYYSQMVVLFHINYVTIVTWHIIKVCLIFNLGLLFTWTCWTTGVPKSVSTDYG